MSIQRELLKIANAKREIDKLCINQPLTGEFEKVCNCDPGIKSKRHLKSIYGIVKGIDSGLMKGHIQDNGSAIRTRNIAVSRVISYMVRNKIVDIDIIAEGIITLEQVVNEYTKHFYRTKLIVEWIQKYDFIQNAIIECANEGKPYKSKNHDEIMDIEEKIDELDLKLNGASKGRSLIYNVQISSYEDKLQKLRQDDFLNGKFSIEDICYKIVLDGSKNNPFGNARDIFKRNTFKNSIWYLSKTAQNKLISLIVKSYKSMNEDDILKDRMNKNKEYKKEYMKKYNKKTLSANDKRELVQLYKADGLKQVEVAKQIACSIRTVQNYWYAAS